MFFSVLLIFLVFGVSDGLREKLCCQSNKQCNLNVTPIHELSIADSLFTLEEGLVGFYEGACRRVRIVDTVQM